MGFYQLIKKAFASWQEDNVTRIAAALAYYTAFSLSPLIFICIAIAGLVFGKESAQNQILDKIQGITGEAGIEQMTVMLQSAGNIGKSIPAIILGIILLLIGASGVFAELQAGFNTIWHVKPRPDRSILTFIKDRIFSFTVVLIIAFLMLVSLIISALISSMINYLNQFMTGAELFWWLFNVIVSIGLTTLLFAIMYKVLPDIHMHWRDVWLGAFLATMLFTLGKFVLELYIAKAHLASAFGAAGALIVILVWVYYSAQILFFGAEFTKVYSIAHHKKIKPARHSRLRK